MGPVRFLLFVVMSSGLTFVATAAAAAGLVLARRIAQSRPPVAARIPHNVLFGAVPGGGERGSNAMSPPISRVDDLFWLRSDTRDDPGVLAHLRRENRFADIRLGHLKVDKLYDEMLSRLKQTDVEAPYAWGGWYYYSRTEEGQSYRIHCRKLTPEVPVPGDPREVVLLDVNAVAKGAAMCDVGAWRPSPDHKLLAYAVDFTGSETYDVVIKDIATGHLQPDKLSNTSGDLRWGADNTVLFYGVQDVAHRPYKVFRHVLGTPQGEDVCIYTEDDERFWVHLSQSDSGEFLFIQSGSKLTSEVQYVRLTPAEQLHAPILIARREHDVLYSVEHSGEDFLITTNRGGARNFKIVRAPIGAGDASDWVDVVEHRRDVKIDGMTVFRKFIGIDGRAGGLARTWIARPDELLARGASALVDIPAEEPVFTMGMDVNKDFDATALRYTYTSPTCPMKTLLYDVANGTSTLLKQREVPNVNPSKYKCQMTFAKAADGTEVPISILYRPDTHVLRTEDAGGSGSPFVSAPPLYLYGYGSYGASMDPEFDFQLLSLADRGVVCAVAHIRGGGEMGRLWYEEGGRLMTKMNTFTDFITCAKYLTATGWGDPARVAIEGASAGGMLMGAVVTMEPEMWKVVVAKVAFTDVLTTMSDPTIPLTVTEYEEWGNPNERDAHDYMGKYSPMDNIRPARYPRMLFTAGLNDTRVAYWEPAKFVQRLREANLGTNEIFIKVEMGSGHFSFTDRYKRMKENALCYSFILDGLGIPV